MKYLRSQIDHIKKYIEIMLMLTKKNKKNIYSNPILSVAKIPLLFREQGTGNRE